MPNRRRAPTQIIIIRLSYVVLQILSILAVVSLPPIRAFYFAEINLKNAVIQTSSKELSHVSKVQFGFWGLCYYNSGNEPTCLSDHYVTITQGEVNATANWHATIGMVFQPLATAAISIIFIFAKDLHYYCVAIALAALIQTAAFLFNIVVYIQLHSDLEQLGGANLGRASYAFFLGFFLPFLICGKVLWNENKKSLRKKSEKEQSQNSSTVYRPGVSDLTPQYSESGQVKVLRPGDKDWYSEPARYKSQEPLEPRGTRNVVP